MKRDAVDFHRIDPAHTKIDARLWNWKLWCNGNPRSIIQPMFMLYRADDYERELSGVVIDRLDAQKMQNGVSALPDNHRAAITWHYVAPCSPMRIARALGETLQGLGALVTSGRQMLINRRI